MLLCVCSSLYPASFADMRGYELVSDDTDHMSRDAPASGCGISLDTIRSLLKQARNNEEVNSQLHQQLSQLYMENPDACYKQLCFILNEELGIYASLAQRVMMYTAATSASYDQATFEQVQQQVSTLHQLAQKTQYSIPSPATPQAVIQHGVALSVYCDALTALIDSSLTQACEISHVPDTSDQEDSIESAITILVANARHIETLESGVRNVHLKWYNKLYRGLCYVGNMFPKKTLSWESAALATGAFFTTLYCLPKEYAEQYGVRNMQRTFFGPYFDVSDPQDKEDYEAIKKKIDNKAPDQEDWVETQLPNRMAIRGFSNKWVYVPPKAREPYQEHIVNKTLEESAHTGQTPQDIHAKTSQLYRVPQIFQNLGNPIVTAAGTIGTATWAINEITKARSTFFESDTYKQWKEKFAEWHRKLKNEDADTPVKADNADDVTLDDPRFNAISDVLRPLKKILEYMEDPYKFVHGGDNIPRSVLLTGKSGTGKSFVAHALHGSLKKLLPKNAEFLDLAQADWKNLNKMGVSDAVDAIIQHAKTLAPCIIFIDEIHTYQRASQGNSTFLNELLRALDTVNLNKNPKEQVFVIGATNHVEELDDALLRDARFGERIYLPMPGFEQRKDILQTRCEQVGISTENLDFDYLASITYNCPLSTLEKTFEHATFLARRDNMPLTFVHFYKAVNAVARKITPTSSLSYSEQAYIASNIASQGFMQYTCDPDRVDAMTICYKDTTKENPHALEYGSIFTRASYETLSVDDAATHRQRCKQLLAGKIGEELLMGHRSSFREEDLTEAYQEALKGACNGIPFQHLSEHKQSEKRDEAHDIFTNVYNEAYHELHASRETLYLLREMLLQEYFIHRPVIDRILSGSAQESTATASA